jgi:hypothetical protein
MCQETLIKYQSCGCTIPDTEKCHKALRHESGAGSPCTVIYKPEALGYVETKCFDCHEVWRHGASEEWEGRWKPYLDAAAYDPDLTNTVRAMKFENEKKLGKIYSDWSSSKLLYKMYQGTMDELWQKSETSLSYTWNQRGQLRPAPTGDPQYSQAASYSQAGASGSSSHHSGSSHGKSGKSPGKSSGHKSSSSKSHGKGSSSRGKHK